MITDFRVNQAGAGREQMLYRSSVRNLIMQRQFLDKKADRIEYNDLFRLMSPVRTPYWCRPGSPPSLAFRAGFSEYGHVFDMRSRRIIVKGRFQGGSIAYVFADELPLFASVYCKDRRKLSYREFEILELLQQEGPMSIDTMKGITGRFSKQISPVLHKLQQKFLVFEDQADDEWDRAWYLFETEFPEVDIETFDKAKAMKTLVMRFAYLNVFIRPELVQSFYCLPMPPVINAVSELVKEGIFTEVTIGDGEGYVRTEDIPLLEEETTPGRSVYVLHRNDFLVRSNEDSLLRRFNTDKYHIQQFGDRYTVMYFVLIDGEFRGFLAGFFKIQPDIIEDIILELNEPEREARKQEILDAVELIYDFDESPVKRYCGEKL